MKKTMILISTVTVVGLAAVSAIPVLAQEQATDPAVTCPYHDQADMSHEDMEQWMGSADHDEWMGSAEHDRTHGAMGNMDDLMNESGFGHGSMMGFSG